MDTYAEVTAKTSCRFADVAVDMRNAKNAVLMNTAVFWTYSSCFRMAFRIDRSNERYDGEQGKHILDSLVELDPPKRLNLERIPLVLRLLNFVSEEMLYSIQRLVFYKCAYIPD